MSGKTMRAAVFTGERLLDVRDISFPEPGPGEVRIKVECATICGTDVHIVAGEYFSRPPVVLGHEFAGVVDAIGGGVTAASPGDRVTVEPHKYCRVCKYCKTGREHLCLDKRAYGSYYNGGFAQYVVVPENTVYILPDGVCFQEGALAELVGCCVRGMDRGGLRSGETVAILGCSSVGMVFVKLARRAGAACIIVSEPDTVRRSAALENGADAAVPPAELTDILQRKTGGLGPDVVIECSGVPAVTEEAIKLAGRGGRVVVFGVAPPGKTIAVEPNLLFLKELSIIGSTINPFTHYRAVELLPELRLGNLVTHVFPLSKINEAIDTARRGEGFKIAIEPNA